MTDITLGECREQLSSTLDSLASLRGVKNTLQVEQATTKDEAEKLAYKEDIARVEEMIVIGSDYVDFLTAIIQQYRNSEDALTIDSKALEAQNALSNMMSAIALFSGNVKQIVA